MNNIVIFEAENQPVQVRLEGETVWLNLQQLPPTVKPIRLSISTSTPSSPSAAAENESALQVMGDDKLRVIAHELLVSLRENVAVDWAHRESARVRLRVLVKRILRKYGYPPDLQGRGGANGVAAGGGAIVSVECVQMKEAERESFFEARFGLRWFCFHKDQTFCLHDRSEILRRQYGSYRCGKKQACRKVF